MADALCGPSNALQAFQKQTSVDRTLQQDRIATRQPPTESFRSAGPNVGILDAEFEAFQAGRSLENVYPEPQLLMHGGPKSSFQPNFQQQSPAFTDWATDFQNLKLDESRGSPIPQSHFHQYAPLQRSKPETWHEDFLRQQNRSSPLRTQSQQQTGCGWAYGYSGGLASQNDLPLSSVAQQKQPEKPADDIYDEAAFERAFESARLDMSVQKPDAQLDQDLYRTRDAGQRLMSPEAEAWLDHSRVGSVKIEDEAQEETNQDREENNADELARTAGQLLEHVKEDQSQKFQESNFLSLMRQLRDKEVRVEGDKLVDVSMPSSA